MAVGMALRLWISLVTMRWPLRQYHLQHLHNSHNSHLQRVLPPAPRPPLYHHHHHHPQRPPPRLSRQEAPHEHPIHHSHPALAATLPQHLPPRSPPPLLHTAPYQTGLTARPSANTQSQRLCISLPRPPTQILQIMGTFLGRSHQSPIPLSAVTGNNSHGGVRRPAGVARGLPSHSVASSFLFAFMASTAA